MSRPPISPSRSGLAAAAALIGVIVFTLLVVRSGGGYELNAAFDQVHGLVKGGEVRAGGLKVGKVREITLGRDGLPRVRMSIADDFRLRRGGTAEMRVYSLAGEVNRYVALHQGNGDALPDGATLARVRTDQPVEIDQVLSTLDPATRADVRGVLRDLDRAAARRGRDIAATLTHSADAVGETAQLLAELRGDGDSLRSVLRNGRLVLAALVERPDALGDSVDELAGLLRTTARREEALAAGIAGLPQALRNPRSALERADAAVADLRALVRDAGPAVHGLVPFSRDLRAALRPARTTLVQAAPLVRDAPRQLRALKPLLVSARPTLRRLAPVLTEANPMLDQARVRLPDVFAFFSNWADFTANFDANGHAARIGLVFDPAPVNTIGPSDSGPGSLVPPFARTPGVLEGEPWRDYSESFVAAGSG